MFLFTFFVTFVEQNKVKVYYSENANATTDLNNKDNKWTENLTNKNVLAPMKDNSDNEMTNIKNVYASGYCSYVLTNNNEVYAVGYNNYGQQFQNNTATNTKLTKIKNKTKPHHSQ